MDGPRHRIFVKIIHKGREIEKGFPVGEKKPEVQRGIRVVQKIFGSPEASLPHPEFQLPEIPAGPDHPVPKILRRIAQ